MPEQFDIFADSADVALRNDVLHALEQRSADAARKAWQALAQAFPNDSFLPAMNVLVRVLEEARTTPLANTAAVAHERQALAGPVSAAALQAMGTTAGLAWLQPLWTALAERCAHLPFDAAHADDHATALWLRAGQWARAGAAVEGIPSWRRIPAPLAWMAEAQCRLGRLDDHWALLAELAWLSPRRLATLLRGLNDPLLNRLHKRFDASFEDDGEADADLAWFPAWAADRTPGAGAAPGAGRARPEHRGRTRLSPDG